MPTLEKASGPLALITAFFAVGAAFENFTNLGLFTKLSVVGIAALFVSLYGAQKLASRVKHDPQGFGEEATPPSKLRIAAAITALAFAAAIEVAFGIFVANRFAARLDQSVEPDASVATLTAAYTKIDRIVIQLPAQNISTCKWADTSTGQYERTDLQMIDFNSPNPKLQIDNFFRPQSLRIVCRPGAIVRASYQPTSASFYQSDQISSLLLGTIIAGGVIWLIACMRFAWLVFR